MVRGKCSAPRRSRLAEPRAAFSEPAAAETNFDPSDDGIRSFQRTAKVQDSASHAARAGREVVEAGVDSARSIRQTRIGSERREETSEGRRSDPRRSRSPPKREATDPDGSPAAQRRKTRGRWRLQRAFAATASRLQVVAEGVFDHGLKAAGGSSGHFRSRPPGCRRLQ